MNMLVPLGGKEDWEFCAADSVRPAHIRHPRCLAMTFMEAVFVYEQCAYCRLKIPKDVVARAMFFFNSSCRTDRPFNPGEGSADHGKWNKIE